MFIGRPTFTDLLKLLWFSLTHREKKELRWKVDLVTTTLDRVIGERDAALEENTRLHAELAKALIELANEKARVARAMAPSLMGQA